jgi:hypothetical protein
MFSELLLKICTNAERGKGGYDVFNSTGFECSFQRKVQPKLQEDHKLPVLLNIIV